MNTSGRSSSPRRQRVAAKCPRRSWPGLTPREPAPRTTTAAGTSGCRVRMAAHARSSAATSGPARCCPSATIDTYVSTVGSVMTLPFGSVEGSDSSPGCSAGLCWRPGRLDADPTPPGGSPRVVRSSTWPGVPVDPAADGEGSGVFGGEFAFQSVDGAQQRPEDEQVDHGHGRSSAGRARRGGGTRRRRGSKVGVCRARGRPVTDQRAAARTPGRSASAAVQQVQCRSRSARMRGTIRHCGRGWSRTCGPPGWCRASSSGREM